MDRPFIELMCSSFYNDMNLASLNLWENSTLAIQELKQELIGLVENTKLEDEFLYYELFNELDRGEQQKVTYLLLAEHIAEKYSKIPNYNIIDSDRYYESADQVFLENNIPGVMPASDMWSVLFGTGHALPTFAAAAAPSPFVMGIGAGTVILAAIAYWKNISRAGWTVLNALNVLNKQVGDLVHNFTRSGKVKKAIFINNVTQCWKRCNIDPKELSRLAGLALDRHVLSTPRSQKQADCLAACYLSWTISQVRALAESYVKCLQATGERTGELNDLTVFLSSPAGSSCGVYFNVLKKHNQDYMDALEVVFRDEPELKENWKRKYNQELNTGLTISSGPVVGRVDGSFRPDARRAPFVKTDRDRQDNRQDNRQNKQQYQKKSY